jgi:hypothetical protein
MWIYKYTDKFDEWIAMMGIHLYTWQYAAIQDRSQRKLLVHGRKAGATMAIAVDALWKCSQDATVLIVTTDAHMYYLASAILNLGRSIIDRTNGNDIYLNNGSRILVTPSSEASSLGLRPDALYVDNAGFIDVAEWFRARCPVWINYNPHERGIVAIDFSGFTRIVVEGTDYMIGGI